MVSPVTISSSASADRDPAVPAVSDPLILSEETNWETRAQERVGPGGESVGVFWRELAHVWPPRLGLVILAGAKAVLEPLEVASDTTLFLTVGAALGEISPDGLDLLVLFSALAADGAEGPEQALLTRHIPSFDPAQPWLEICLPLGSIVQGSGRITLQCGPGPRGEPNADWLAVYELVIGPAAELTLNRARGHRDRRYRGDLVRFEQRHDAPLLDRSSDYAGCALVAEGGGCVAPAAGSVTTQERQQALPTSVVEVANRALSRGLQRNPPDFQQRLSARVAALRHGGLGFTRKLRVLSLCSGVGHVERALLQGIHAEAVSLTLWDRNADVVELSASRLASQCDEVIVEVGDVNALDLQGERFDVILCVSGLHHLIELEHVFATVAQGLQPDGEFWSMAEFVGRNGYRMWPGARAHADGFFRDLPEAYRVSRVAGGEAQIEQELAHIDHSVQSLEGVRSQEIEGLLLRFFAAQDVQTRSCFLWGLLDQVYVANYNLHAPDDLKIIEQAARLDVSHQRAGGRPAMLNGVYRRSR